MKFKKKEEIKGNGNILSLLCVIQTFEEGTLEEMC
jgi:hypothetical protein